MPTTAQQIIARLGETDQLALQAQSAHLDLERARLRMQLVQLSQHKAEKTYFLQEAIVLLEQARLHEDAAEEALYVSLTVQLGQAYMLYYEIEQQQHFALICQQIVKPLSHLADADIYCLLAYAAVVQQHMAMARHWLLKYSQCASFDVALLWQHPAFSTLQHLDWFKQLRQRTLHG